MFAIIKNRRSGLINHERFGWTILQVGKKWGKTYETKLWSFLLGKPIITDQKAHLGSWLEAEWAFHESWSMTGTLLRLPALPSLRSASGSRPESCSGFARASRTDLRVLGHPRNLQGRTFRSHRINEPLTLESIWWSFLWKVFLRPDFKNKPIRPVWNKKLKNFIYFL